MNKRIKHLPKLPMYSVNTKVTKKSLSHLYHAMYKVNIPKKWCKSELKLNLFFEQHARRLQRLYHAKKDLFNKKRIMRRLIRKRPLNTHCPISLDSIVDSNTNVTTPFFRYFTTTGACYVYSLHAILEMISRTGKFIDPMTRDVYNPLVIWRLQYLQTRYQLDVYADNSVWKLYTCANQKQNFQVMETITNNVNEILSMTGAVLNYQSVTNTLTSIFKSRIIPIFGLFIGIVGQLHNNRAREMFADFMQCVKTKFQFLSTEYIHFIEREFQSLLVVKAPYDDDISALDFIRKTSQSLYPLYSPLQIRVHDCIGDVLVDRVNYRAQLRDILHKIQREFVLSDGFFEMFDALSQGFMRQMANDGLITLPSGRISMNSIEFDDDMYNSESDEYDSDDDDDDDCGCECGCGCGCGDDDDTDMIRQSTHELVSAIDQALRTLI